MVKNRDKNTQQIIDEANDQIDKYEEQDRYEANAMRLGMMIADALVIGAIIYSIIALIIR